VRFWNIKEKLKKLKNYTQKMLKLISV